MRPNHKTLLAALMAVGALAGASQAAPAKTSAPARRIVIASDSTAAPYSPERYPQMGWGMFLSCALPSTVQVVNMAHGGRSTGTYVSDGFWKQLIDALAPGDPVQALPLWIKLLYSGVAEELLVRWGMMSVMLFGLWRMLQPRGGAPRSGLVWMVIALAALLGAASNLPAAMALMGGLSPELLAYVLLNHTVFGLLAGYIYIKFLLHRL